MKNLKYLLYAVFFAAGFSSCDEDTDLPVYDPLIMGEDFQGGADNTLLVIDGWKNVNTGASATALWKFQVYQGDGYAEFNPYGTGDVESIGWLISPPLTLEANNKTYLRFRASQSYVSSANNTLQALVSTDFDGTNVNAATWTPLNPNLPTSSNSYFQYVDSGELSLSAFSGQNVYVAFKVVGSATDPSLDGAYQIDNFRLYNKK